MGVPGRIPVEIDVVELFKGHAGAVEDFTQAIELKPDDPDAYQLRGHSNQALGQEAAAQIDFEKAMALESAQ